MRLTAAIILTLGLLASPALAQSSRYAPAGEDRLQKLTDELSTLIDEAEKARAADYRFLRDLRDLVRRYDRPWRVEQLFDDFRDGDFTANPAWVVKTGRFEVNMRDGLHSRIEKAQAPQAAQQQPKKTKRDDMAKALLGALLKEALKEKPEDRQQQPAEQSPQPPSHGQIYVAKRITNAFSIRIELRSFEASGRVAMGPYQGAAQNTGYSLAYNPGATPSLELLRITGRGTSILDSHAAALKLEDGKSHIMEWTRDAQGVMAVSVDGKTLLQVTDRGFRDAFDGFTLVNFGGEYALREITVTGTAQN